ncbi:hypothetical protein PYW08_013969 [Mythimna loreyi]|uniref:Uncharacterized protein n=1 Tax=Mythimna loreyi TaxID=667449 RepID=A0ACC2R708_9NEOP|nr:hypothetical protein PYW08_013969 [Mythimna loreyi]
MLISYILMMIFIISILGKKCDDIRCSNIIDEVCAIAELKNRSSIKLQYQNICYMRKAACEEESFVEVNQVEDELCYKPKRKMDATGFQGGDGRRVADFSIVGSHQACNHSCPIACTEAYEPACALIWNRGKTKYTLKMMLNHCHIDLFSCATGLNVTIDNLNSCLSNAVKMQLPFVKSVAAMNSLGLITEDANELTPEKYRRANVVRRHKEDDAKNSLKSHLKEVG